MIRAAVLATILSCPLRALATAPTILSLERKVARTGDPAAPIPKTYYVGKIQVGDAPEEMQVHFETGSGSLLLDSTRCLSSACMKHHRYSPDHAADIDRYGSQVEHGHGQRATMRVDNGEDGEANGTVVGVMIRDKVCFGAMKSRVCGEFAMLAAESMSDDPFSQLPFDGLVGLGMKGISISSQFNFMERFSAETGLPSSFGLFVPRHQNSGMGEISLGGYNAARLDSTLSWVSAQLPEKGYWQVKVTSMRIGTKELELCKSACLAIIDSSTTHISLPAEILPSVVGDLNVKVSKSWLTQQELCNSAQGEDLQLVLESGAVLTLEAKDYLQLEGNACQPQFHPISSEERANLGKRKEGQQIVHEGGVGINTLILGEPLLRKYYTVFDSESKRVGFGLSRDTSTDEILLMQGDVQRRSAKVTHEL